MVNALAFLCILSICISLPHVSVAYSFHLLSPNNCGRDIRPGAFIMHHRVIPATELSLEVATAEGRRLSTGDFIYENETVLIHLGSSEKQVSRLINVTNADLRVPEGFTGLVKVGCDLKRSDAVPVLASPLGKGSFFITGAYAFGYGERIVHTTPVFEVRVISRGETIAPSGHPTHRPTGAPSTLAPTFLATLPGKLGVDWFYLSSFDICLEWLVEVDLTKIDLNAVVLKAILTSLKSLLSSHIFLLRITLLPENALPGRRYTTTPLRSGLQSSAGRNVTFNIEAFLSDDAAVHIINKNVNNRKIESLALIALRKTGLSSLNVAFAHNLKVGAAAEAPKVEKSPSNVLADAVKWTSVSILLCIILIALGILVFNQAQNSISPTQVEEDEQMVGFVPLEGQIVRLEKKKNIRKEKKKKTRAFTAEGKRDNIEYASLVENPEEDDGQENGETSDDDGDSFRINTDIKNESYA